MQNRLLLLCGVLAPIVYVITVVVGGLMRPDYSHIAQPVSDLIAAGAPNKPELDLLFALYNVLTLAFGFGLLRRVRGDQQNRRMTAGTLGALLLMIEGLAGGITLFFPEDTGGLAAGISPVGTMHIVFAGLSSLTSIGAILFMGVWFRGSPALRGYGLYSFITVVVVFVSGGLAGLSVASHSPFAGLIERITIGGFIQWLFVIGLVLYSAEATKTGAQNSENSGRPA